MQERISPNPFLLLVPVVRWNRVYSIGLKKARKGIYL